MRILRFVFIYLTLLLSIIAISGELLRRLGTGYGSLDNYKFIFKSKIERHRNGLHYPLQVEIDLRREANHRKAEVGNTYLAVRLELAVGRLDYSVADSSHRGFERGIRAVEIGKGNVLGVDLGRAGHAVKSLNKSRLCQRGIGAELSLGSAGHVALSVHKLDCIVIFRIGRDIRKREVCIGQSVKDSVGDMSVTRCGRQSYYRVYLLAYSDYMFLRFGAERRISVYLFRLQVNDNNRLIHAEKHLPVAYEHIKDKREIAVELCF